MLAQFFQYGFFVRGLEAGIIIAVIAPLVGMFLVLRRYSLIADTLAHVSFAGIAIGIFFGFSPIASALVVTVISSLFIEKLRISKKVFGESALSLFLSGSLALAVVLISFGHGFTTNLFSYLFGSILTVSAFDVIMIGMLAVVVFVLIYLFYKELMYVTFDEDAARASGIPVGLVNLVLVGLSAFVVSLSIPVVGVLLVSALLVIPVVTALQLKKGFLETIVYAEIFSVVSVVLGMFASFYLDLAAGGTIVLLMIFCFVLTLLWKK